MTATHDSWKKTHNSKRTENKLKQAQTCSRQRRRGLHNNNSTSSTVSHKGERPETSSSRCHRFRWSVFGTRSVRVSTECGQGTRDGGRLWRNRLASEIDHTRVPPNRNCNKQKWISPFGQQTPIHHRRQEHSVQARHGPRGKILTETAGIRKMLLQRNLQNPIEKNLHHRRIETRIGTRWTRDHNQLQRNPHIPQLRDNTWTNNRKDGSTDVKQLIRETLSSHQRLANETIAWQWVVFNMWQLQEEDKESVRTPAVTSHWAFRDKGTRQTRNQNTTISNSTTTTKRKKEGPAARQRRRMMEHIRRCLLTSNQRMWDRYAASTDSTNSSRRSKDASETQFSWAKPGDQ